MGLLIALIVVAGLAYRAATPAERERFLKYAAGRLAIARAIATRRDEDVDEFYAALRARTPFAFVAWAGASIGVLVGAGLLFGAAPMGDPGALIRWGANVGTLTTNGEWWRLVTACFVNASVLQLIVNVLVVAQVGALLERLVGRLVPAAVYLSAGVAAGLANVASQPIDVTVSASGAAFGLYGLLAAVVITQQVCELLDRRRGETGENVETAEPGAEKDVPIPLAALKKLGIGGALFLLYTILVSTGEFWGFAAGLAYGVMLAPLRIDRRPTPRRVGIAAAISATAAAALAFPLRNIADVKPEIARVLAAEEHTTKTYQATYDAFAKGRATAETLARVADGTNVSELKAIDARLAALRHVPPEHEHLVSDARDYLRLRCEAWRLRADAVRKSNATPRKGADPLSSGQSRLQAEARFRSNLSAMGRAESAERASMTVFERLRGSPATP
ncbi:MAG TPA: rhomboid family intramembrane serine protease [Vicinamibacterales bacterium]|nr:rhomboid family intramembrane serine protease [Vicinamibacterales bacterium]